MTKFCDVCKQILKCNYCAKYGKNGQYIWLEQHFYLKRKEQKKQKENLYVNENEIDLINQQQLQIYTDYFNSKKD